jgi:DNA-binding NtrC family response regulator
MASIPKPKVLLVDDDDAVREMMMATLMRKGFEVVAAANVGEALKFITMETFDALITDLHMPNAGDGFRLFQWLAWATILRTKKGRQRTAPTALKSKSFRHLSGRLYVNQTALESPFYLNPPQPKRAVCSLDRVSLVPAADS